MPLMPGSPRPDADDGVYRSIFQQPQLEIPAKAPSYAWFEFLLHPDALQRHLETLRHQRAHGVHSATSAMELVREFLDQAQLVADEGRGRNNRYRALLCLAAQVTLQMEIPLMSIEEELPPHFQRLLLDGVVDFAESGDTKGVPISLSQAQLLHQRWTLRTLVRESQNGYLTSSTKSEAEDQMSGFQVALSEIAQHHLQIAQSVQQALSDDGRDTLSPLTQFEAYYDLAVYFFSFNAYEKAYECFSRASEVVDEHAEELSQVTVAQRGSLEGYLKACEAVLEARSTSEATANEGKAVTVRIEEAFAARGWQHADELLAAEFENETNSLRPPLVTPSRITCDAHTEASLRAGSKRQREHFRIANDVMGAFTPQSGVDASAIIHTLRQGITSKMDLSGLPDTRQSARSLVIFLMLHGCWDVLEHWRDLLPDDHSVRPLVEFAVACGSLTQYVAASAVVGGSAGDTAGGKSEFSATRCNKILSDILTKRRELLFPLDVPVGDDGDNGTAADAEVAALLIDLPLWLLDTLVCVCAGLLHRSSMRNLSDHRVSFDLSPYGDLALIVAFAQESPKKKGEDPTPLTDLHLATTTLLKAALQEIVTLHARGVQCLVRRCPREPRWHSARADLSLYPIVKLKQPSLSDPRSALCSYLSAASLATNYFADDVSVVDIIDQGSLVRLSQCLVKVGAHVAAAVLYQCFSHEEFKYGLRVLQIAPESHDPAFFQYFWELPFLELLVHLHSNPKHFNTKFVTLLTHLLQSPELNCSNPQSVQKEVEQRILRCYFRDLCKAFLG